MSNEQYESDNSARHASCNFAMSSRKTDYAALAQTKPAALTAPLTPASTQSTLSVRTPASITAAPAATPASTNRPARTLGSFGQKRKPSISPEKLKCTLNGTEQGVHQVSKQISSSMQDIVNTTKEAHEKTISNVVATTAKLHDLEKWNKTIATTVEKLVNLQESLIEQQKTTIHGNKESCKEFKDVMEQSIKVQQTMIENALKGQQTLMEQFVGTTESSVVKQMDALKTASNEVKSSIEQEKAFAKQDAEALYKECVDRLEQYLVSKGQSVVE